MKIRNILSLMAVIVIVVASSAWGETIDELITIDSQLVKLSQSKLEQAAEAESYLKGKEAELFDRLLDSEVSIGTFIEMSNKFESGIDKRFVSHLKFAVNQENRVELKAYLEDWTDTWGDSATVRGKKKIAYIYGNEVNLKDGEWRRTPDGKRFWVSNEYPDIVLTPAEYRRYAQTAVVVEE